MYAVVATGGKQYRVVEGQQLQVERVGEPGTTLDLPAVLLVDGSDVLSTPDQLTGVSVEAKVIDEGRGPKIDGFIYKNKTNQRRRFGHRQTYATIEITGIKRA